MARMLRNADELQAAIEADELEDQMELAATEPGLVKMSVREYAKARKLQPQLVYYYIRRGYIDEGKCICGRKVIDVASADEYLASKANNDPNRPTNV